ncbi:MAG TPA: hypothetical protein VFB26_09900 [Gaiellaceae bacterium]|nr:hypothetical protein [Gaiellaceae bacterium]
MGFRARPAGDRRRARASFVALALAVFVVCAAVATWPASRHVSGHYVANTAPGYGEQAAGDYLQLVWGFWLFGHQLERGEPPWIDPYSFQPHSERRPVLLGLLLGIPFWPLERLFGPAWAYDLVLLLTFVAAGGFAAWWLRSLELPRAAALLGGVAFALAPYRVQQSTGHLLGQISFLLPATLLALERRRFAWAALALAAIPATGQVHLALGAIPLYAVYAWLRLPRWRPRLQALGGVALAVAVGLLVQRLVIATSIVSGGRSLGSVRHYSATLADFVTRSNANGVERFVFLGWATPLLALAGLAAVWRARGRRLALFLGGAALVPMLLALGTHFPGYAALWHAFPPLRYPRVPERLMPIACLALAALVAFAATRLRWTPLVALLAAGVAADLHVPIFGAQKAYTDDPAYAAIRAPGRLVELPVFRPDIDLGSAYLAYAMQSPRERPQGYSTTAPQTADGWAKRWHALSCGELDVPRYVRFVAVHRGLYRRGGYRGDRCPDAAEARLRRQGFRLLARAGPISTWQAPWGP